MNWVLILWYVAITGGVSSQQVTGLSKDGCQKQALKIMAPKSIPIICVCVEKS